MRGESLFKDILEQRIREKAELEATVENTRLDI